MTPGIATLLRCSGKAGDVWYLEWTYASSNAVTLDTAQSDASPDIATPVADSGAGEVLVTFPKSDRVRLAVATLEPATPGTGNREAVVHSIDASAGTLNVSMCQHSDDAPTDPVTGARARLTLLLERN